MEFNLADLFESVVDLVPDQTAVVADEPPAHLRRRSTAGPTAWPTTSPAPASAPGDRVGLQLANGSEYLEGMLACFKIRAVPVNVNYRYVSAELRYLYEDAGLVGLVFHSRFAPAVGDALAGRARTPDAARGTRRARRRRDSATTTSPPWRRPRPARTSGPRSADDLYCVYTGGTTGMPKGRAVAPRGHLLRRHGRR